jgi:hypothetical protein
MAVGFSNTNKPLNPRGQDASPKGYNRASLFSGKALDFDGVNDYADVVYSDTIGSVWTWSSIIEADALSGYQVLFGGTYGANNAAIVLNNSKFNVYNTSSANFDVSYTLETGKKYHITLSQNGSTISAYINGILINSITSSTTLEAGGGSYYIGRNPYSAYEFFNGKISGVKLFNTALTAAQVADLYNNPEKVVPTGVDNTALKLWLPMMEGAGTTAYDGSGNGNHGTISGATYVNGVGAPSPQSAVMDWNKGQNLLTYSEEPNQNVWTKTNVTITADQTTAPDGQSTADKLTASSSGTSIVYNTIPFATGNYMVSVYVKAGTSRYVYLRNQTDGTVKGVQWYDLQTASVVGSSGIVGDANIESANNGFYRISLECEPNPSGSIHYILLGLTSSGTNAGGAITGQYVHAWGFQTERKTTLGPYVRTGATAQTSEVLLPQGLTTGRDITGVNLFENVRKQGALNLDGNSWAEVHDNASLDLTTAVTLEAWVYWTGSNSTKGILGRWFSGVASYMLYASTSTQLLFFINTSNSPVNISGTGWKHIVGTYDSTNRRVYIDGQEIGSGTGYTSPIAVGDKPIEIGRYAGNTAYQYDGDIAQPRIYNRALTASEVLQNYNSGKNTYK